MKEALENFGLGADRVYIAIEESVSDEILNLKSRLNYLSVIGVVSPMIGLTGTVIGMIGAFASMGVHSLNQPTELASHIGEVLVATASGLIVSIPGFVFYYVFRDKLSKSMRQVHKTALRLVSSIPFDYLKGVTIGALKTNPVAPVRLTTPSSYKHTVCPSCSQKVEGGTTACPHCGVSLLWT